MCSNNNVFSPFFRAMCLSLAITAGLFTSSVQAAGSSLTFVEEKQQANTLGTVSDVAVSTDGKFVYSAAVQSGAVAAFERNALTGVLTYRNVVTTATVPTLTAVFGVAASPDNKNIYTASPTTSTSGTSLTGAITTFSRDPVTGALTVVNDQRAGQNGITLNGFVTVIVSPDGKSVYGVTGNNPDGIAVFTRNLTTGALTLLEQHTDDVNGNYLGQAFSQNTSPIKNIAISANGQHLYVTATDDNAVSVYSRDLTTGSLTLANVYRNGIDGVDGITKASSLSISPDGSHLYVSGQGISGITPVASSIAIFAINQTTGALTYLNKVTQGVGGVTSINGARSLAVSPDGRYVYCSAIISNTVTAFARDPATGLLTIDAVATNGVAGVNGLSAASGMSTDPLNRHLYVAGQNSQAVAVFALPTPAVGLSLLQATTPLEGPAITLDPQLEVYDSDSVNLASASISISEGFVSTDVLSITGQGGISVVYDAANGIINLTGSASLADYQATLRTLAYQSGADASLAPGDSSSRVIKIIVSDGDNLSAAALFTVTVQRPSAFTVTFVDWDSGVLKTEQVLPGVAATAPANPTRTGYRFSQWDVAFDNVTADTTVTAQYTINTYSVTFDLDGGVRNGGGTLAQTVNYAQSAVAPTVTAPAGKTFIGWSGTFNNVTANITVTAQYSINSYTVIFDLNGGSSTGATLVQTVNYGDAAVAPTFTAPVGKTFTGWSSTFNSVTANITVTAQYSINTYTVAVAVTGNAVVSPETQQINYGASATFLLSLIDSSDFVSITSNCNAALQGMAIVVPVVNADCTISVNVSASLVINKESDSPLAVNTPSRFSVSGGEGDKSLTEAWVTRAGIQSSVDLAHANALIAKQVDGSYLFSAERTGRYTLEFMDAISHERATVSFDVMPYIAFSASRQPVQENTPAQLRVWLSDEPIEYPVSIGVVATGASLPVQQFELNAEDNLQGTYSVTATAQTAHISVASQPVINAFTGTPAVHTLVVQQAMPALSLTVTATQAGQKTSVVNTADGQVTLNVMELDSVDATYSWNADGLVLNTSGASATFNAADVPAGIYDVSVNASTLSGRTGQYRFSLQVISVCPVGDCADTGVSKVPASANLFAQTPSRLALCPHVDTQSRISSCQAEGDAWRYAEVQSRYTLALGSLSGEQSWQTGQFAIALNDNTLVDSGYIHVSPDFNFNVQGLEIPGQTVSVAIPLLGGNSIPKDAVWRKFINNVWQDFVQDDANQLHSAPRNELGYCPGVSSNLWVDGLVEGHGCIRLTLEDGGANDDDGAANNVIRDPGALAVTLPPPPPEDLPDEPTKEVTIKSSGGSMTSFGLLLLGLLGLVRSREIFFKRK